MEGYRVCFGCVADEKLRFQRQAVFLLASLRALGCAYASADFVICVVGRLAPPLAALAEAFGAQVESIEPLSGVVPAANKLRFLERPALADYDYAVLLDCDTAIAGAPNGLFAGTGVRARLAGGRGVPPAVLADLSARAGLPPPEARYVTAVTSEPTPLYCNSGVVVVAGDVVGPFAATWIRRQAWLLAHPELLPQCTGHANQASLSLALAEMSVAFEPLDLAFNFPVHRAPEAFYTPLIDRLAPVVLHYNFTSDDGTLLPSPAAGATAAIERVNAAWRQAGASFAA